MPSCFINENTIIEKKSNIENLFKCLLRVDSVLRPLRDGQRAQVKKKKKKLFVRVYRKKSAAEDLTKGL